MVRDTPSNAALDDLSMSNEKGNENILRKSGLIPSFGTMLQT